jgi:hypothetical protein
MAPFRAIAEAAERLELADGWIFCVITCITQIHVMYEFWLLKKSIILRHVSSNTKQRTGSITGWDPNRMILICNPDNPRRRDVNRQKAATYAVQYTSNTRKDEDKREEWVTAWMHGWNG